MYYLLVTKYQQDIPVTPLGTYCLMSRIINNCNLLTRYTRRIFFHKMDPTFSRVFWAPKGLQCPKEVSKLVYKFTTYLQELQLT